MGRGRTSAHDTQTSERLKQGGVGALEPAQGGFCETLALADGSLPVADAGLLSNYGGGGHTIKLPWTSAVNTNGVVWQAAIRRLVLDSEDFDTSHTYDFNTVTDTAPGTIGHITEAQITFTDGADMDSLAAGELFILRIKRDAAHASDSMTSDARLIPALLISET